MTSFSATKVLGGGVERAADLASQLQRFSIGFKSGLLGGQSGRTVKFLRVFASLRYAIVTLHVWDGALSCCNINKGTFPLVWGSKHF